GAEAVLAAWPDKTIDASFAALLANDDWWPRHHALAILDARKLANDDARQIVALHDIEATTCGDRRVGVTALKKIGHGDAAFNALKKLRADAGNNGCLLSELSAAEDALKKR
ncbi:MAG TPA: hypothetical protein VGO62_05700, partial [Myxococcota bacterium]